jgi:hypothetical protein
MASHNLNYINCLQVMVAWRYVVHSPLTKKKGRTPLSQRKPMHISHARKKENKPTIPISPRPWPRLLLRRIPCRAVDAPPDFRLPPGSPPSRAPRSRCHRLRFPVSPRTSHPHPRRLPICDGQLGTADAAMPIVEVADRAARARSCWLSPPPIQKVRGLLRPPILLLPHIHCLKSSNILLPSVGARSSPHPGFTAETVSTCSCIPHTTLTPTPTNPNFSRPLAVRVFSPWGVIKLLLFSRIFI